MLHQYHAQRFRSLFPPIPKKVRGKTIYYSDPRDRQVGTIPVGTILCIQDGACPFRGLRRDIICREPWIVEAWIPRDYAKRNQTTRRLKTVRIAGGHLALVRSLRNRNRVQLVADWILLASIDAGLEKS